MGVRIFKLDNKKDYIEKSINFDGSNLTDNFYIYKIEAGDYIESKKKLLINKDNVFEI